MYQTKNLGLNITEIDKDSLQAFNFDTDLGDNFKAIDEKTLSHRNITNCLLEVPQDIKVEITTEGFTLKEGSKVYIPNGKDSNGNNIFREVIVNTDHTAAPVGSSTHFLIYSENSAWASNVAHLGYFTENIYVSDVQPVSTLVNAIWYDTANNKMFTTINSGETWLESVESLPICICTTENSLPKTIDQVFNGFGYIGSTVFALPGVKCLIPNGRNEDGSLNNILVTSNVSIFENSINAHTVNSIILLEDGAIMQSTYLGSYKDDPAPNGAWGFYYNTTEQVFYHNDNGTWIKRPACKVGNLTNNSGVINSFKPKKPFQAVDYFDYSTKIAELEAKIEALQAAVEALQGS